MKRRKSAWGKAVAVWLSVALTTGSVPMITYATTTQDKINQAEDEKNVLEGKLEDTKDELDQLQGQQNSLKGQLNHLNGELTKVSENLADLEQQITEKLQEIADTQASLEAAKAREEKQYASMKIRIRYMYESYGTSYLEALFSSKSIAAFLNISDFFEAITTDDRQRLDEYEANRNFIESEEARLQEEKIELDALKVQAESEKSKVSQLIEQTAESISEYADEIAKAEAEAEKYEAEIKKKEEDLEYLKKKLAEEIALSQAAANAQWRDISEVEFAEGDLKLLANLIYCEAGGEPYEGQVAVGAVVMNRVLSSKFPNTIVGVIYQNRQFSPVGSGRLELALTLDRATNSCYQAAQAAMSGISNVGNCLFFRTPIPGLTGISIGGHIFY